MSGLLDTTVRSLALDIGGSRNLQTACAQSLMLYFFCHFRSQATALSPSLFFFLESHLNLVELKILSSYPDYKPMINGLGSHFSLMKEL